MVQPKIPVKSRSVRDMLAGTKSGPSTPSTPGTPGAPSAPGGGGKAALKQGA